MVTVKFTQALRRFYPNLTPIKMEAKTVAEIVNRLEENYPGLQNYIVDEHGKLRQHVNIFIENTLIKDRETLRDQVNPEAEVYIMQALSGG